MALLAGSVGCLLLALEVGTRLFTHTSPALMIPDPVVGQRYVRSFEGSVYDRESHRKVPLRFNRDGLRGPDRPLKKAENVRRIAVFGDSMIASQALEEDQTLVAQLERMLNATSRNVRWEVLNCGISGSSTAQEWILYREVVSHYAPDIVLCAFFVGNDVNDNCARLSTRPRIYFDVDADGNLIQRPFSAKRAVLSQWLNRHSRFYVWQKDTLNRARHQASAAIGAVSPGDWIFCSRESDDFAYAWKITGALLDQFRRDVERQGGLFAVVLIPSAAQICHDCFQSIVSKAGDRAEDFDQNHPNRRLAELCGEAGIPFWPLTDDFRKAAPSADTRVENEWLFLNGVGHFNERGSRVAAESIYRFLTEGDSKQVAGVPYVSRVR